MSELGQDARDLIERALRDEVAADPAELVRIRRRVLAASAGASVFGIVGKAMAVLGKASLGPVLKAFGVGVAVTVVAIGLPMVLSTESQGKRSAVVTAARATPPKVVSQSVALGRSDATSTLVAPAPAPIVAEQPPQISAPVATAVPNLVAPPSVIAPHVTPSPTANAPTANAPTANVAGLNRDSALPVAAPTVAFAEGAGQAQSFSVPSSPATVHRSSPLVQELTLLENVQSELRAGHGALALKLLDGSSFPAGGQLQAERLAAEVFASCQAGNSERARSAARLFLSRYPSSPAAGRVRASCGGGGEVGNAR